MLDQQDMTLLRGMMTETVKIALQENNVKLNENLKEELREMKRDIRDEVHALLRKTKNEIVGEITEFLDQAILPQIHELQVDMALVKNHLKLA